MKQINPTARTARFRTRGIERENSESGVTTSGVHDGLFRLLDLSSRPNDAKWLPAHTARLCFSCMVRACCINSKGSQRLTMQSRAEFPRLLQFCQVPLALLANKIVWLSHAMLFFPAAGFRADFGRGRFLPSVIVARAMGAVQWQRCSRVDQGNCTESNVLSDCGKSAALGRRTWEKMECCD